MCICSFLNRCEDPLFALSTPIRPYEMESFTTSVLRRILDSSESNISPKNSACGLLKPISQACEKNGASPLQASEYPSPSSPNIPLDSSSAVSEAEACKDVDQSIFCEENGHDRSTKRKCPGWFGKGYGKNKKLVKKRKLR